MPELYCRMGGLMEDPEWHWEVIGEAPGTTTKEVADNLAQTNSEFAKYYDPETVSYWGWRLAINIEEHKRNYRIPKP